MAQKLTRVCFFYTPHQSGQVCFPEKIWYEDIDVDRSIIFFFFFARRNQLYRTYELKYDNQKLSTE